MSVRFHIFAGLLTGPLGPNHRLNLKLTEVFSKERAKGVQAKDCAVKSWGLAILYLNAI